MSLLIEKLAAAEKEKVVELSQEEVGTVTGGMRAVEGRSTGVNMGTGEERTDTYKYWID